jgi:hypothetical protein
MRPSAEGVNDYLCFSLDCELQRKQVVQNISGGGVDLVMLEISFYHPGESGRDAALEH